MELRLAEQKKLLEEANERIDELSVKFLLLQEKLISDAGTAPVVLRPAEPPANLKVVELSDSSTPVKVKEARAEKVSSYKLGKSAAPVSKGKKGKKRSARKQSLKKSRAKSTVGPKSLYSSGQNLLLEGRYKEARKTFALFMDSYSSHSLADNSLYWIGEAFYSEKEYKSALKSFLKVTELYPNENKAPDALLKVGYSYIELDDYNNANQAFKRLVSSYPDTVAASKAVRMLKSLLRQKKEGSK